MKSPEPALASSFSARRSWPWGIDAVLFLALIAGFYGLVALARYWWGAAVPAMPISRSPRALPGYALYSLARLFAAYALSLMFAVGYGYTAAYQPRVERLLLALLDVLQSIPVLSFLPGVMLAMIALAPSRQIGVELGSILLIFTGEVWNMAFSFYSSLKSIPRELREAANVYAFGSWQRFWQLELPFSAIGLLWNSMVSMANGWFFLMACEMFVLGNRDFRLPGLGSYLQSAASAGDMGAIGWGLGAMIAVIVLIDQILWRPLIAWSAKFKFEQVESSPETSSWMLALLRSSRLSAALAGKTHAAIEAANLKFAPGARKREPRRAPRVVYFVLGGAALALTGYAVFRAGALLGAVTANQWAATLENAGITFGRVTIALAISCLWTIPAGVAIGFRPGLARIAQPLAQVAASVPATALLPILLLALLRMGGGLGIASVVLMLLAAQWYILFNIVAGALAIPSELREVGKVFRLNRYQRWRIVILPGIFPYLITGLVTASGGAWNASIVAEYFHLGGRLFTTAGLGAQISSASDAGRFDVLLLSTIVMAAMVVSVNRLVWRPLYRLAETRFRLDA